MTTKKASLRKEERELRERLWKVKREISTILYTENKEARARFRRVDSVFDREGQTRRGDGNGYGSPHTAAVKKKAHMSLSGNTKVFLCGAKSGAFVNEHMWKAIKKEFKKKDSEVLCLTCRKVWDKWQKTGMQPRLHFKILKNAETGR